MKLEIIEIGTSDYNTEAGKKKGLFIEPVKEHFDRLPDCMKENVAISDHEGEIQIYYIPSDVIRDNRIPKGLRGCNSVNEPHPTVLKMGYGSYMVCQTVKVVRIKTLIDKYGITDVSFLKIDTEGHDLVILDDFLKTCSIIPKCIQFESNVLTSSEDVKQMVKRLFAMGYSCRQENEDMICVLS